MESSKDVRDALDVSKNETQIRETLRTQVPPETNDNEVGYSTQGLDCLVVFVRQFYSYMASSYLHKNGGFQLLPANNPALRLAWMVADDNHPGVQKEWTLAKKDALDAFKAQGVTRFRFKELISTKLMHETLWSLPQCQLHNGIIAGARSEDTCHEHVIVVNRHKTPNLSFQQCINDNFRGELPNGDEGQYMSTQPDVIRVMYTTKKNINQLLFSTIKYMYLPVADSHSTKPVLPDGTSLYTLVAVVSLMTDRVRTYWFMGGHDMTWPKSSSEDWSIEDDVDGEYMLLYACAGDSELGIRYREFSPSPEDWEQIADDTLTKVMEMYEFQPGSGSNYR